MNVRMISRHFVESLRELRGEAVKRFRPQACTKQMPIVAHLQEPSWLNSRVRDVSVRKPSFQYHFARDEPRCGVEMVVRLSTTSWPFSKLTMHRASSPPYRHLIHYNDQPCIATQHVIPSKRQLSSPCEVPLARFPLICIVSLHQRDGHT